MKQKLIPNKKIGEYVWNHQDLLGSGAFGKVYRGYHEITNQVFAIKEQNISEIKDPYMKQALKNEISVMKKVKSPNVVNLIEVYQSTARIYMIIDFCNGGDLRSFLTHTPNGKVSEETAINILSDILAGFKALVDNGIIHRDVKPENILINDGIHKLADFGLSKIVTNFQSGLLQTSCGTPLYMAPQILMNQDYTTKCDIWSVGLIYYEMIFGNTPWPCKTQFELITNINRMPVRFPHHEYISDDSRYFIQSCLTIDETLRFNWSDCFNSSLFTKKPEIQGPRRERKYTLDNHSKSFLTKLQQLFSDKGYSIEKKFKDFAISNNESLLIEEFTRLVFSIDPNTDSKEITQIFRQIDTDNSHTLSLQEFKKYILETDYEFKSDNDMLEMQRAQKLLKKLRDVIVINSLDMDMIFKNFDKSNDGALNLNEFIGILSTIDENILDKEALFIFHKFDHNRDGSISLDEFKKSINEGVNFEVEPKNDNFPKEISSEAKKGLQEIRLMIKANCLDLKIIFSNFDADKSGTLTLPEFKKFVSIIHLKFKEDIVTEMFNAFDYNRDGSISFLEFSKYIN